MQKTDFLSVIAIVITLVMIVLLLGSNINLQNEIRTINENQLKQTQEFENKIKGIDEKLEQTEYIDYLVETVQIEKETILELQLQINETNTMISELTYENQFLLQKINDLENQINFFENKPPISVNNESKPTFQPKTIIDGNGLSWTSHFIKEHPEISFANSCNSFSNKACYVNISEIQTPYGIGISVDSIGSPDWTYLVLGLSDEFIVPNDGIISISGKFLKNDSFYEQNMEFNRSHIAIFVVDEVGNRTLPGVIMLNHTDQNEIWYEKETYLELEPGEIIRIGIGMNDGWSYDWNLYGAWADVKINAKKLN